MSMLNEFLAGRQQKQEEEKNKVVLRSKEHIEHIRSLYKTIKEYLKDTEEKGLVKVEALDRPRTSKEIAPFVIDFSNEKIYFSPLVLDYEKDEQIKVVIRDDKFNLISDVYLFVSKNDWWLFDRRPNKNINSPLTKESFESLLISLLEK